jgi:hypothetical protein
MTSNGHANDAPRGTRARGLNNAETGGRKDIMTIILANGASYDSKERVVPDYHSKGFTSMILQIATALAIGALFYKTMRSASAPMQPLANR